MEKDLISVIVPVYNSEHYLERCIESITKQTYTNLEIILINDGSTDGSKKICERFAEMDSRVVTIHRENEGVSHTRNVGLARARGRYITFIDSDDFVKPHFIQALYELAVVNKADIVICNYESGRKNEFTNSGAKMEIKTVAYSADDMLKNWHGRYKHLETVIWNKLYRKDLFTLNHISYPEGYLCGEDVYTTHQLVAKASKVVITEEKLYYYFSNADSLTHTISEGKVRADIMAQKQRIQFFAEHGYEEACERMTIKLQKYYMLMYCKLQGENSAQIKKELLESFGKAYQQVCAMQSVTLTEQILFGSFKYFYRIYEMIFHIGREKKYGE